MTRKSLTELREEMRSVARGERQAGTTALAGDDTATEGTVPWTITAFQRSRRETWKAIRLWLLVLASAVIGFAIPFWMEREHVQVDGTRYTLPLETMTLGELTLSLASFVLGGAAIIGITVGIRRHYRCPRCDTVPMGTWIQLGPLAGVRRDVDMNPSVCPKCGARLS